MNELRFLSPTLYKAGTLNSPLSRALPEDLPLVQDLWLDCKVEIRGNLELVELVAEGQLVVFSPRRGILFSNEYSMEAVERLRARGLLAYDATGALAGLAVHSERLMRRLTDLDLDRLPAAGPFARVPAIVLRDVGERFRVYVPQELGHDVALAVLDAIAGLANTGQPNTEVRLKPDPNRP